MKKLFIVIILFSFAFCNAQTWFWAEAGYGSGMDDGTAISYDHNNHVISTGAFTSTVLTFGSYTLTNSGDRDVFITKHDLNGNVIWAKSAAGIGFEYPRAVSCDNLGNIYVVGQYSSPSLAFGTFTINNNGYSDGFLAKYDANGNFIWAKNIGSTGYEAAYAVSTDKFGNIFISGVFGSTMTLGAFTLNPTANGDVFVAKYDSSGNVLWAKSGDGDGMDEIRSITTDNNGNAFVVGTFRSTTFTLGVVTLTKTAQNFAGTKCFIAKYDKNGNTIWARTTTQESNEGFSICSDPNGSAYISGFFYAPTVTFGPISLTNAGSFNSFIVKYDSIGNEIWAKNIKSPYNISQAITSDSSSIYISGGGQFPVIAGSNTITGVGSFPMFIVRYDLNGNEICALSTNDGGASDDEGAMTTDHQGNLFVCSDFGQSQFVIGTNTLNLTPSAYANVFIAKLNCFYNIGINELGNKQNENLLIYPNPASNSVFISIENGVFKNSKIEVINYLGQIVLKTAFKNEIDISFLSDGVYTLQLISENQRTQKRFIITK